MEDGVPPHEVELPEVVGDGDQHHDDEEALYDLGLGEVGAVELEGHRGDVQADGDYDFGGFEEEVESGV